MNSTQRNKSAEKKNTSLLFRIISLAFPYKSLFYSSIFLSLFLAPISIIRPYLVQVTVDDFIVKENFWGLHYMILILCFFLFIEAILSYLFTYVTGLLGQSIIKDLRIKVFSYILQKRVTYFDQTPVGNSTTRTISDIETINTVFSEGVITIVSDILTMIFVLGIMLYSSWSLTLVCLITLPFLLWSSYWFKEAVKKSFEQIRSQVSIMNSFLQERISGMKIVQIFNAEKQEMDKFKIINKKYTEANVKSIFYYAVFFPIVEILSAASLGLMVWYGAGEIMRNELSIGVLVAFPLYLGMLFRPVRMLADKFNSLQMGMVAANRVFELIDNQKENQKNGNLQIQSLQGKIEFKDVYFTYQQDLEDDKQPYWTLEQISFELSPGKSLAIIGSTGAGKSSIINILNRFYEISKGEIRIDDYKLQEIEIGSLRKRMAVVLQDVFLFSGTIMENITLRDPFITEEKVIAAAKAIGADTFILKLPGTYNYQVMERGATLSMGQRQMISFVRALVRDPDILILDEATSSVDPESEQMIQNAIIKLTEKRTSLIIAHRLSTISQVNEILILEKGKIIEKGSPEILLSQSDGYYKKMIEAYQLKEIG